MTTEAAANLASAGSDSVQPSDGLDNSESLDFWEPEEEQANPEAKTDGIEGDSETDEGQQTQEAAETDQTEAAGGDDKQDEAKPDKAAEPDEAVTVTMPDGEKLSLKELKAGHMRDRDYRHKTTEVANTRRELEAKSARVVNVANALSELLMAQVPPAPDPQLFMTDPIGAMQQKAAHDHALEHVKSLLSKANEAKEVQNTLTNEQRSEIINSELGKLADALPQTSNIEGRKKFFESAVDAGKKLGFSDNELAEVMDHRMFVALHYVGLGMKAEAAGKKAAQKVVNVPPVAAPKQQQKGAAQAVRNRDAMAQLAKTGSLQDAMAVDFD